MQKGALPPEALEFFRAQGSLGGKVGAAARLKKVSPERRKAIAKAAAAASAAVRSAKAAKRKLKGEKKLGRKKVGGK